MNVKRTGTTGINPPHTPAAPAPKGPAVDITRKPIGPPSDRWEGVGVNSNPAAYESKTGVPATSPQAIAQGEQQIANLDPQVSRIDIDPNILDLQDPKWVAANPAKAAEAKQQLATVQHLVTNATANGGRADLTLWSLDKGFQTSPAEMKQTTDRFAKLVKQLETQTHAKPGTFIVSAQNEPNRTKLSPQQMVSLYKDLDSSLKTTLGDAGRKNVKIIAGHLTEGDQSAKWIKDIVPQLGGVVDGFSFHVYAHNGETSQALEGRLANLRNEVFQAMPKGKPMPELMLTEYGVRGIKQPGDPSDSPGDVSVGGKLESLRDSPQGAFREAQLVLAAARTGFSGAIRWGANPGGGTPWTSWSMTGTQAEGFDKKPAYYLTQLFTSAIGQGWTPTRASAQVQGESVATWRAPTGPGAAAVVANSKPTPQDLSLGGFAPNQRVQVLSWNSHGGGKLASSFVVADAQGRVEVSVAPGAVTAATSLLNKPA